MKNKEVRIKCGCGSEMLVLSHNEEWGTDVSIWTHACWDSKLSLKDRLRHMWNILFTGRPYGDQLIIEKEDRKKLKEFLDSIDQ